MSAVPSKAVKIALGVICFCLLCGILTVGLWPFHAPRNDVAWVEGEEGLWFGEFADILSSGTFAAPKNPAPASVELWIDSGQTFDSNNLIVFYTPGNPKQFGIEQSGDDLFVVRQIPVAEDRFRVEHVFVDHVFKRGVSLLITATSGSQGTRIYLDGVLAKSSPQFAFSTRDLSGLLIVGNSPVNNFSWSGHFRGLAFYGTELSATEVSQHYAEWSKNKAPAIGPDENPIALYPFNERSGSVVHNQIKFQPDLFIPQRYFVLHETMLDWPWKEFHWSWGYLQDDLVNISGLMPLGLFFCAYFARVQGIKRPVLAAILVGAVASLTIEVTQSWLPTRDSSCTDVITNISGTAIGAWLYRLKITQFFFTKFEDLVNVFTSQ